MAVNDRMKIKMEQIARLRVSGLKDVEIARQMNLSYGGLQRILAVSDYKDIEDVVLQRQLAGMDDANRKKIEAMRQKFRDENFVPEALQTVIDAVRNRKDLRTSLAAAKIALQIDPDKTFAPTSEQRGNGQGQTPPGPGQLPDQMLRNIANKTDETIAVMQQTPRDISLVN